MDVCDLPTGLYRITRHPAFPRENGDSWVVEITPVCLTCPCKMGGSREELIDTLAIARNFDPKQALECSAWQRFRPCVLPPWRGVAFIERSGGPESTNHRVTGPMQEIEPPPHPPGSGPVFRAAQYVRMSIEHQRYSTENQGDKIHE